MHCSKHLFILLFIWQLANIAAPVQAMPRTEEDRLSVLAKYAASRKNWSRAIRYVDRALSSCIRDHEASTPKCIILFGKANDYYARAGKLSDIPDRIKQAYKLAHNYMPSNSASAQDTRRLYYTILLSEQRYADAIMIVQESLTALGAEEKENAQKMQHFGQLFSLYGLTAQHEEEIKTLKRMLKLNIKLDGNHFIDSHDIILNLGKAYCKNNDFDAFNTLMLDYKLTYTCLFH